MKQSEYPIWAKLQDANLVSGEYPQPEEINTPWFVKILLAFSGWFASLFLLGFVAIGFEFIIKNNSYSLITAGLMIISSYLLLLRPKNEFVAHLALSISMAGQLLILFALFDIFDNKSSSIWLLLAMLEIILVVVMPNFLHRFFSAFVTTISLDIALSVYGVSYLFSSILMLVCSWLWLHEFHYPDKLRQIHAVGYGLILALIIQKGTLIFANKALLSGTGIYTNEIWALPWVGEVVCGIAMLYLVWKLFKGAGHKLSDPLTITALLATVIITVLSIRAQGITVGMMILILGFAGSNRILQGVGVMALVFYISTYYTLLQTTLLVKSQILFVIGMVLLAVRLLYLHLNIDKKEVRFE